MRKVLFLIILKVIQEYDNVIIISKGNNFFNNYLFDNNMDNDFNNFPNLTQKKKKKHTKEKEFIAIFSYEKKSNIIKEKIEAEMKGHVLNYLVRMSTMSIYMPLKQSKSQQKQKL